MTFDLDSSPLFKNIEVNSQYLTLSYPSYGGLSPQTVSVAIPEKVYLVAAPFHKKITEELIQGAQAYCSALSLSAELVLVPGALEVGATLAKAVRPGLDLGVALGCIIRGETYHFEIVAMQSAQQIAALTLEGYALGNGLLTTENEAQAWSRALQNQGNKGFFAVEAALSLHANLYGNADHE